MGGKVSESEVAAASVDFGNVMASIKRTGVSRSAREIEVGVLGASYDGVSQR